MKHVLLTEVYVDSVYIVRCSCGWSAQAPLSLIHRVPKTHRPEVMGFTQHQELAPTVDFGEDFGVL